MTQINLVPKVFSKWSDKLNQPSSAAVNALLKTIHLMICYPLTPFTLYVLKKIKNFAVKNSANSTLGNFAKVKNKIILFKVASNFSLRQWKRSETKVAEEYCRTTTQAAGWSCCGWLGSGALDFGFQLDSPLYTNIWQYLNLIPNYKKKVYSCARHSVT
jgi:hypothetical protein